MKIGGRIHTHLRISGFFDKFLRRVDRKPAGAAWNKRKDSTRGENGRMRGERHFWGKEKLKVNEISSQMKKGE